MFMIPSNTDLDDDANSKIFICLIENLYQYWQFATGIISYSITIRARFLLFHLTIADYRIMYYL